MNKVSEISDKARSGRIASRSARQVILSVPYCNFSSEIRQGTSTGKAGKRLRRMRERTADYVHIF